MKAGTNCRCRSRRRCRAGSARKAAEFRPVLGHGRTGAPDDREPAASGNDRMRPALFQDQAFAYAVIGGSPSDRKSVVSGKSVSVRLDLGGRRLIKKKKNT